MTGALQVLSLTDALRDGDFEAFRRITAGFLDQYGEGGLVLVADRAKKPVGEVTATYFATEAFFQLDQIAGKPWQKMTAGPSPNCTK